MLEPVLGHLVWPFFCALECPQRQDAEVMDVAQMNAVIKIVGGERGAGHDKGAERGLAGHQLTGNSSGVVLSCLSMRSIFKVFGVLFLLAKRRACPMEGNDLGLR
ncbi:hypothetical protein [Pseudomonas fluorescens]|jgi:hypothetical protein|uniref:hypothetical protein n=1 Tax=Pseudomonas fluorescens TaxID=294 RepID=UPI0010670BFF|nr:hypothetical protein [Pseudomonas fluorescens]